MTWKLVYLPAVIGFTPHRSPANIDVPHKPSLIAIFVIFAPNGGRPCDGRSAPRIFDNTPRILLNKTEWLVFSHSPGVLNTFVVFLRFFHLARRFWNHTWKKNETKFEYLLNGTGVLVNDFPPLVNLIKERNLNMETYLYIKW